MLYEVTFEVKKQSVVRVEAKSREHAIHLANRICLDDDHTDVDLDYDYTVTVENVKTISD